MKQVFTYLILLSLIMPLQSQITIERSDYTREVGSVIDDVVVDTVGLFVPAEGVDSQVWDYSHLSITGTRSRTMMAGGHPDFPESNISQTASNTFLGIIAQETTFHERLSDSSYVTLGRTFTGGGASLTPISGGANDSIVILDGINIYDNPAGTFEFPMQFGNSNTNNSSIRNDGILTVEGFGIDHAPIFRKLDFDITVTISGYGTLILPHPDGTDTVSFEALLIREERVVRDSFFLNNQLIPDVLANAFGLEPAGVSTDTRYSFVTKGLNRSAFTFIVSDGIFSGANYADGVRDLMTSTTQIAPDLLEIQTFPNPSDGNFTIAFDKTDGDAWKFILYNSLGQLVEQQTLTAPVGAASIQVSLPKQITTGIYHFTIQNEDGQIVGTDKVMVKR